MINLVDSSISYNSDFEIISENKAKFIFSTFASFPGVICYGQDGVGADPAILHQHLATWE